MNELHDYAAEIRRHHEAGRAAAVTAIEHALAAGKLLTEAKERIGHGGFEAWLAANFEFTARTARRYMRLHAHRDSLPVGAGVRGALEHLKTDTVSDLGTIPLAAIRTDYGPLGEKPSFLPDVGAAAFAATDDFTVHVWQVEGNFAHALVLWESEYGITKRAIRYDWLIDQLESLGVNEPALLKWEPVPLRLSLELREIAVA